MVLVPWALPPLTLSSSSVRFSPPHQHHNQPPPPHSEVSTFESFYQYIFLCHLKA